MIAELGHFALIVALCLAIAQAVFPLAGAARGQAAWMAVARPAAQGQFAFLLLSFAALAHAFVTSDFSVAYVAQNSNSALPLQYRIAAVWGAHEGSLLLWVTMLALWSAAVSHFSRAIPLAFLARVLGVMGLVSTGFLLFLIITSNPFARVLPAPAEGNDLNPLLQDFGLVMHPPILYAGYVGFSVAFGFAIAALLSGRLDAAWARWSRPWTIAAWIFLTLGIALGSWWAYYELGWGGWWFWDPVENASFMPWLVGTALLHSLAVSEKRGLFKSWTVLLAICAFSLSLLGTFLVRSGVLTSVHAFASDPARGVFILLLLALVVGGSLALYAWRAPSSGATNAAFRPFARETLLLANNVLLVVAMATVLLGTAYPLAMDALGLGKISVGPPYFNSVFVPLMLPLFLVLGVGMLVRWKEDEWPRYWRQARFAALAAGCAGLLVAAVLYDGKALRVALACALAVWIVITTVLALRAQLRHAPHWRARFIGLTAANAGMAIAHLGLATTMLGIAVSSAYSTEGHRRMMPGESAELAGYTFLFAAVREHTGPNYRAMRGDFQVSKNGNEVARLSPEKRIYLARGMPMTEAGIDPGFTRDLYVSLGEAMEDGAWSVRLYVKPMVRWIWGGALLMALGGIVAASDRRYRIARRERVDAQTARALAGA
ncbi:MAG: heme lyase CcmF/NrfE family subunit [Burkholderiales bacterium]